MNKCLSKTRKKLVADPFCRFLEKSKNRLTPTYSKGYGFRKPETDF